MKTKLSIALGSVLGAAALHLVLAACGHGGTSPANAQQATTCSSWQTGYYFYDASAEYNSPPLGQVIATSTLPSGWEPTASQPISSDASGATLAVTVRKCLSQ